MNEIPKIAQERKKFCPLPWMHLSSRPSGDYRLCCRVQQVKIEHNGKAAKWGTTPVDEIWNDEYYKNVRAQLLNDQPIKECTYCYEDEANGLDSLRIKKIRQFLPYSEKILREQKVTAALPIEIDLKLGNHCNLSCMMCWPTSSSKVAGEIKEIMGMGFQDERFSSDLQTSLKIDPNWGESDVFEANFEKLLPHLEFISATGGEPFANKKFKRILSRMVEEGHSSRIMLNITTNLTLLDEATVDLFSKFQYALLNVSVDGIEDGYEYIRNPGKWAVWQEKFALILKKKVNFNIFITYSAYSVFRLLELLDWVRLQTGSLDQLQMISLFEPDFLNVARLPDHAKTLLTERFETYMKTNPDSVLHLQPVISQMNSGHTTSALLEKCWDYTEKRDAVRKTSIHKAFPEFVQFYS